MNLLDYPDRYRCDVCRKMGRKGSKPLAIKDGYVGKELQACSQICRDNYWMRYQMSDFPLNPNPYSNTGVTLCRDGDECILSCQDTKHCMVSE